MVQACRAASWPTVCCRTKECRHHAGGGEWKERLDQRGLVIRHWAQCRTTVDRVATIDTLAPDDCYDLVFVTMQGWSRTASVCSTIALIADITNLFQTV